MLHLSLAEVLSKIIQFATEVYEKENHNHYRGAWDKGNKGNEEVSHSYHHYNPPRHPSLLQSSLLLLGSMKGHWRKKTDTDPNHQDPLHLTQPTPSTHKTCILTMSSILRMERTHSAARVMAEVETRRGCNTFSSIMLLMLPCGHNKNNQHSEDVILPSYFGW